MNRSYRCLYLSIVIVVGGLLLHGVNVTAEDTTLAAAARNVTQVVAHRGASEERPECTLSAVQRAIEVGATAVEIDVRTSSDGHLFILHDTTLDRTTNGSGPASQLTLAELQKLDAGSSFDEAYRGAAIPTLIQVAEACRGKVDLLLDLKEQGQDYDERIATVIRKHGDPGRTIAGVRTVDQAKRLRQLLPQTRQLAMIPSVETIEQFAAAGVDTIRLWPRWLKDGDEPAERVRACGKQLHLNGTKGHIQETMALLAHRPVSLLTDDPAQLKRSLQDIIQGSTRTGGLSDLVAKADGAELLQQESQVGTSEFLNRDYKTLELPKALTGLTRYTFHGGEGGKLRFQFRKTAVVFAAFEYNSTGSWTFADGRSPEKNGWHLWQSEAYRGSSNPGSKTKPNRAGIWYREYSPKQELSELPAWWLCLGVVDLKTAESIEGFEPGLVSVVEPVVPRYSHADSAAKKRSLHVPDFKTVDEFRVWQTRQRNRFVQRMLYPYTGEMTISVGEETQQETHRRKEFQVTIDGQRLFRFFRLQPRSSNQDVRRPTIVCFMGHGKVKQILDQEDSYQHACANHFAKQGYVVYAMENVGMEPGRDTHMDLDQSLRLEGHGWYSLLFAHQRILLDHVFADPLVDTKRVGVTGVSTGGLLALSAAVMEPRVAATSVQGIFGSMRTSFIRDRNRHCRCGAIPGLLPEFDLPELALLVTPRAIHISNGQKDGFSPGEAKRCADQISELYQRAGGRLPYVTVSPGGHEFALDTASSFFEEHLRAGAAR